MGVDQLRELTPRAVLDVALVAGHLERSLLGVGSEDAAVRAAQEADEAGYAMVLCQPDHVAGVAQVVTSTPIGTAIEFEAPGTGCHSLAEIQRRARSAVDDGAAALGLVWNQDRHKRDGPLRLAQEVRAVQRELAAVAGSTTRLLLDCRHMPAHDTLEAARAAAGAGANSFATAGWYTRSNRFLEAMRLRAAMGLDVQIKWAREIHSLPVLLLTLAEGIDRVHGDIAALLAQADAASNVTLPRARVDFLPALDALETLSRCNKRVPRSAMRAVDGRFSRTASWAVASA